MAHPAQHEVEASRKRRKHTHGVTGVAAKSRRLDRKGGGAVDASSWRPPAAREERKDEGDTRMLWSPEHDDLPKYAHGGRLTAHERQSLPKSDFALPGHGAGPKGAGSGSYPIPDESHARNALARVSQHGSPAEKSAVRRKVHAKYPDIGEK
jgi:hypothetical protein